ncbi:hypothetical protein BV22DRAFT_1108450 [Leucogyrophana mollusca]|uniref:Uncharacterized protein n=1 Tax=Leucogyrophana mollusca TaxID=85980 RepID=A0ACB8AXG4_9AGAM|nr:hypothetical protein BV22DRAFT_1108450 [Leucogyrophana mollusca]
MVRCPGCSKRFKSEQSVTCHLSQPRHSCLGWTNDLARLSDALDIPAPPEAPPEYDTFDRDYEMEVDGDIEEFPGAGEVYADEIDVRRTEYFDGAAEVVGLGQSFLDVFDQDEYTEERKDNLYYPFATKQEWKFSSFLLRSGMSMAGIDELLDLELMRKVPLSFRTAKELRARCEMLPSGPRWSCRPVTTSHLTKSPVRLFYRDPVECLEALFSNPTFHDKMDFSPRRVYEMSARLVRVYDEWMTGDAAWNFQSSIPHGATVVGTVLSSDKTTISTMTGDRVAHPLLISLANIHMSTRTKLSSKAFLLTALLPVAKFLHPTKRMRGVLQDRLVHQCLNIVLKPLKIAAAIGIMMSDPIASIKADPLDIEAYFLECKPYRLNGVSEPFWADWPLAEPTIFFTPEPLHHWHREFWDHDAKWCIIAVGHAEIDFRFSVLQPVTGYRHFKDGISKLKQVTGRTHRDIQRYIIGVIAGGAPQKLIIAVRAMMDFRYLAQAPSISENDCQRILAALQEFHDHKQSIIDAGARRGAKNKTIDNFYIPKLELLQSVVPSIRQVGSIVQWSADITEHAHITEIKDPARASNNNNYDPQIVRYLDREEKRRRFDLATSLKETLCTREGPPADRVDDNEDGVNDDEDEADEEQEVSVDVSHGGPRSVTNYFIRANRLLQTTHKSPPTPPRSFIAYSTAINLTHDPNIRRILVDDVADKFCLPDFRGALADYLQREQRLKGGLHGIGGPRQALGPCALPFDYVQVWFKVRLQEMSYYDRHLVLPAQTVNASPPNSEQEHGRFDTVLVHTDANYEWPKSGLNGHTVVQLRVIFHPLSLRREHRHSWEDDALAYVERFDVVPQPDGSQVDHATQMHVLKRALRSNGLPMGDIIPLKQLRSHVHVIPRFGRVADSRLKSTNVMKYSSTFYLNRYFSKELYYALSNSY